MTSPRTPLVIPAIDLLEGGCVRLYQGDFDQVTDYAAEPLELVRQYLDAGLERLHVVDLDGARSGRPANLPVMEGMVTAGAAVQAGGGIRDSSRLQDLFSVGVHRAVVGSVAVERREQVAEWIAEFGAERIVLAFDVRGADGPDPIVSTHGWTRDSGESLWSLVDYFMAREARHFLCTDIARDGTLAGPNTALYASCARRYPQAAFIASGGVSAAADLDRLRETGIAAIVTGKALLDGRLTLEEIRQFSRAG